MSPERLIVADDNRGLTYRGRTVEELTKEELIAALYDAKRFGDHVVRLHEDYVSLQARMREMR